ncbi:MAG TPA: 4Fe-4S binding protein [Candidatus Blautia faecavium]|uniref:4Fe-4S binding protein n=1 Tax=Candidatus Blautia faecavium TaxID=2838487 RepID=A0A9D2LTK9_9FIRM|nr:4Fe-4S binding protein [Candidatus Blautia faecavium]
MKRRIIHIDEEKCNGCGACADACHEGAIGMVDGKAKLLRDDYCDGLGDCLPACPTGAITFEEREAAAYDEEAVMKNKMEKMQKERQRIPSGCPGSQAKAVRKEHQEQIYGQASPVFVSQLRQWPVQIKLAPVNAPYFNGAKLLVAADCTAYAYAGFHDRFMKDHITLVGCPKLDVVDYSEKLTEIIRQNEIKSVSVVRMEVPCCSEIVNAVKTALMNSGKFVPWSVTVLSIDGNIVEES